MNELNSAEILVSDQKKIRLRKINKIKDYFNTEIQEKRTMSKKLSKYIAAFDYIDKSCLIVLSATSGGISIGIPAGFTLIYSLTTGIIKKLLKVTRKKRRNTIKLLCLLKAN